MILAHHLQKQPVDHFIDSLPPWQFSMSAFCKETTILSGLIALTAAFIFAWLLIIRKRKRWIALLEQQALLTVRGLLVLVNPIAKSLDSWTGLNNFSWGLGYSLGIGTCLNVAWQMGLASDKPLHRKVNQVVLTVGLRKSTIRIEAKKSGKGSFLDKLKVTKQTVN